MELFDDNEYVIVSDFDGTITLEDSNVLLVKVFGNAENALIEADFRSGLIGNREAFVRHFDVMRITLREYNGLIDDNIRMEPEFDRFLEHVNRRGVPLFIVSAGFHQAVERVLGGVRLQGVEVYANELSGEPYITPVFMTREPVCDKTTGPCGNCKRDCLKMIRKKSGRKILYIGDGITDRCAIGESDLLFAKDALAEYCDVQGLPYTPYNNFDDIASRLGWDSTQCSSQTPCNW